MNEEQVHSVAHQMIYILYAISYTSLLKASQSGIPKLPNESLVFRSLRGSLIPHRPSDPHWSLPPSAS